VTRTRRGALALALATTLAACGGGGTKGTFRDQLLLLADDGTVLALVLTRSESGTGEAKGWLGVDGRWTTPFYDRFPVTARVAPDLGASVRAWASATGAGVRASLRAEAGRLHLSLRSRTARMFLDAEPAAPLGAARDPEGASRYGAARATLRAAGQDRGGWLLTESTPADAARGGFVEYGDFVFLAAARPDGDLVVAKRSRGARGYDACLLRRAGAVHEAPRATVELDAERLVLSAPGLPAPLPLPIRDRERSTGVAPAGHRVGYEVLLLRGGSWTGVAFTIRPAS